MIRITAYGPSSHLTFERASIESDYMLVFDDLRRVGGYSVIVMQRFDTLTGWMLIKYWCKT